MQWGTNCETYARNAYAAYANREVAQTAFVDHPSIPMAGASPDGLIGEAGLIEIKCPTSGTHIKTLLGEPIDPDYIKQMMWQMACTGRVWCDFVSYDPRLPTEYDLLHRVERDLATIEILEAEVRIFLGEVDAKIAALAALVALAT